MHILTSTGKLVPVHSRKIIVTDDIHMAVVAVPEGTQGYDVICECDNVPEGEAVIRKIARKLAAGHKVVDIHTIKPPKDNRHVRDLLREALQLMPDDKDKDTLPMARMVSYLIRHAMDTLDQLDGGQNETNTTTT